MPERPAATNADQERSIVLSVALSCWKRPSGNRVEFSEFFDLVRRACDFLDKERPDLCMRIGPSNGKIKSIIAEMKRRQWAEEERMSGTLILKITPPAGHLLKKDLLANCPEDLFASIRLASERAVEFHMKMINPGDCD